MWRKLPIWIRAIILGLVVASVPSLVWGGLAMTNLRLTPRLPWSAPVMAVVLWLYWRYLRGDGPPHHLAAFRREQLRAVELTPRVWRLALLGGGLAVAAVWASFAALRGFLHIAAPTIDVSRFPLVTVIAAIVMGSAVAGVAEEAGFRGYMQLPLERAYGPGIAVATTSVLFTLVHLTHGSGILPFLPFYLVVAVVYGLLTLLTGSILPSMTLHFVGDVMMFALRYVAAREGAIASTATGTISLRAAIAFAVLAAMSVLAFRLLAREKRGKPPATSLPGMLSTSA
jgi:membrane protease YdiL (CAAX protease family)